MKRPRAKRARSLSPPAANASNGGRTGAARCAVILGYKDGDEFIGRQIESIHRQTFRDFRIYVFDDASRRPFSVVAKARNLPSAKTTVTIRTRSLGAAANFLDGLASAGDLHDFYAFCDQDDVWHDDKLERAVSRLERFPAGPALYFSSANLVGANAASLGRSTHALRRTPCFANALVESIFSGNAAVMNRQARDLVVKASTGAQVAMHDWWSYMVVAGAGGHLVQDPEPALDYRLHGGNLVGGVDGIPRRLRRYSRHLGGRFKGWTDGHVAALERHRECLTPENRRILDEFAKARVAPLPARLRGIWRSGVHCQGRSRGIALAIAAALGRI